MGHAVLPTYRHTPSPRHPVQGTHRPPHTLFTEHTVLPTPCSGDTPSSPHPVPGTCRSLHTLFLGHAVSPPLIHGTHCCLNTLFHLSTSGLPRPLDSTCPPGSSLSLHPLCLQFPVLVSPLSADYLLLWRKLVELALLYVAHSITPCTPDSVRCIVYALYIQATKDTEASLRSHTHPCFFQSGFQSVLKVQAILLPQFPSSWDYRCAHPLIFVFLVETRFLHVGQAGLEPLTQVISPLQPPEVLGLQARAMVPGCEDFK
ncbi:hypothetical protein AAY473_036238 [Plecturocebus cupreus]